MPLSQKEMLAMEMCKLEEAFAKRLREFNTLKDELKSSKENSAHHITEFTNECLAQKSSLLREVASLEARKKEALLPLDDLHKEIEDREKKLQEKSSELRREEERLNGLNEQQILLDKKIKRVDLLLDSCAFEKRRISERQDALDKRDAALIELEKSSSKEREASALELSKREEALMVREAQAENSLSWVEEQRRVLKQSFAVLKDRQETLKRAFDEALRKNIL